MKKPRAEYITAS